MAKPNFNINFINGNDGYICVARKLYSKHHKPTSLKLEDQRRYKEWYGCFTQLNEHRCR